MATKCIIEINRIKKNHTTFNAYNPVRGKNKNTLMKNKASNIQSHCALYLHPSTKLTLIAQSKREGWNSLYLYTHEGELVRQLTRGIEVTEILGLTTRTKSLLSRYLAQPYRLTIFSIWTLHWKVTQFSNIPGLHNAKISSDGKYAFESNSALNNSTYICRNPPKTPPGHFFPSKTQSMTITYTKTILDTLYADDGTCLLLGQSCLIILMLPKISGCNIRIWRTSCNKRSAMVALHKLHSGCTPLLNEGFIYYLLWIIEALPIEVSTLKATHRSLGSTEIDDQMVGYRYIQGKPFVDAKK